MMKRIVLCADDYGQAPAISHGILSLLQAKRLSAVSCMVNTVDWDEHAAWLEPFYDQIDLGLHFNLTFGTPLSLAFQAAYGSHFPGLGAVLKKSALRRWDTDVLFQECCAQIEAFRAKLGFLPHFIDGHQHIHQFPMIREALIKAYLQYWPETESNLTFIRLVDQNSPLNPQSAVKLLTIRTMGAFFGRLLRQNRIPHNKSFSGIYPFSASPYYSTWFPRFLKKIHHHGLIMCHPGMPSNGLDDPIASARYDEYRYLISPQFLTDCEQAKVTLSRFGV